MGNRSPRKGKEVHEALTLWKHRVFKCHLKKRGQMATLRLSKINQKRTDSLFSFISFEAVKGMRVV